MPSLDNLEVFYNKWAKVLTQIPSETLYDQTNEQVKSEEFAELKRRRRLWAVAMSEEVQELLKDYRQYALTDHLIEGVDDLQ